MKRSWLSTLAFLAAVMFLGLAQAEMLSSSSISNKPAKERPCASQARRMIPAKMVLFEIDSRYDVAIEGTSFCKSAGPDLRAVKFTGLLTRTLQVKAV